MDFVCCVEYSAPYYHSSFALLSQVRQGHTRPPHRAPGRLHTVWALSARRSLLCAHATHSTLTRYQHLVPPAPLSALPGACALASLPTHPASTLLRSYRALCALHCAREGQPPPVQLNSSST
jgi:hypothetical protein